MKVSYDYYMHVQNLIGYIIKDKTDKELSKATEEFKTEKFSEEWIYHFHILMLFSNSFVEEIKKTNQIEQITVDEFKERFN